MSSLVQSARLAASASFQEIAPVLEWLNRSKLTFRDLDETIADACRGDLGATTTDIVRYVVDEHGFVYEDEDKIRWLTAFALHRGVIELVMGRRFRAATPRPEEKIVAVVAFPPSEYEAFRPYLFDGRPAWVMG